MNFTAGELIFYAGMGGMALTLVAAVVVIFVLAGSRKRLRSKLNEEYGKLK